MKGNEATDDLVKQGLSRPFVRVGHQTANQKVHQRMSIQVHGMVGKISKTKTGKREIRDLLGKDEKIAKLIVGQPTGPCRLKHMHKYLMCRFCKKEEDIPVHGSVLLRRPVGDRFSSMEFANSTEMFRSCG